MGTRVRVSSTQINIEVLEAEKYGTGWDPQHLDPA